MKATKWYVHWPGLPIAYTVEFESPQTEQKARQYVRQFFFPSKKRLPNGTVCWRRTI